MATQNKHVVPLLFHRGAHGGPPFNYDLNSQYGNVECNDSLCSSLVRPGTRNPDDSQTSCHAPSYIGTLLEGSAIHISPRTPQLLKIPVLRALRTAEAIHIAALLPGFLMSGLPARRSLSLEVFLKGRTFISFSCTIGQSKVTFYASGLVFAIVLLIFVLIVDCPQHHAAGSQGTHLCMAARLLCLKG